MHRPYLKSSLSSARLFFLLLFGWFLLNILQAIFTEIGNDEAYYWLYSQNLAWGYYDHPPFVALVVKAGTLLFGDTVLGVRFFVMLAQVFFLFLLYGLTQTKGNKENVLIFFIVSFSVVMIQIYGFVATPDVPLLLFTVLFLLAYKYFVETKYSWEGALFLALCMAGLMYSKYHGAFVIIFVVLSNVKLLMKPSFYISVLLSVSLYLPHIFWQVNNDFPSLKYHLVERSKQFQWIFFLDYLVNQLPVFNPFTLGAGMYVLFRRNKKDYFEKALRFLFAGFLIFFFFWNFKGRVEPHWTIVAAVPMIILIAREAAENPKLKRYVFRVIAPSLALILVARIFMMVDVLPVKTEWHGDKNRVSELKEVAQGRPVVFLEGFQMPSKYRFYAQSEAHGMGVLSYRNTQYDIWNFDENYRGQPVLIEVGGDPSVTAATLPATAGFRLYEVASYQPYKKLIVTPSLSAHTFKIGEELTIATTVQNPYPAPYIINHSAMPLEIYLVCFGEENGKITRRVVQAKSRFSQEKIESNGTVSGEINFTVPAFPEGEYHVFFAAGTPGLFPASLQKPLKIDFVP